MGAFPRALFSESELEAARWLAQKTSSQHLPTIRQVKHARQTVLQIAGLNPHSQASQLGHQYTVEDFETIIQHVSTPLLSP